MNRTNDLTRGIFLWVLLLACMCVTPAAFAKVLPHCSWPIETTGTGPSNVAYPDTNATYWSLAFDSERWREIIIEGTSPEARFFSFITYDATGSLVDPSNDFESAVIDLIAELDADGLVDAADFLETKALVEGDDGGLPSTGVCAPDRVSFAIPLETGGYFPNAANKYIAAPDLCFEEERLVVVRGKAPGVPDTYDGAPLWQPPGQAGRTALRYWSMCNNEQVAPYPAVECLADHATALDSEGYYTYVVSRAEEESELPPGWLPDDASWLPWGSVDATNILILRNMLPDADFHHSVQAANAAGCVFGNSSGGTVPYDAIAEASECARAVMGEYYPVGVYCDKSVLIAQGWQGCFDAAGVDVTSATQTRGSRARN
jgi:hypothetical protein